MGVMLEFLLIFYCAVTARMSGGGHGSQYLQKPFDRLPEILFSLVPAFFWFGCFNNVLYSGIAAIVAFVVTFLAMESATRPLLGWERGIEDDGRGETLRPIANFIAEKWAKTQYGSETYAWIWAAIKGFLITLPLGGTGIIFWPLAYEAASHLRGTKLDKFDHTVAEQLSGVGMAFSFIIAAEFVKWMT